LLFIFFSIFFVPFTGVSSGFLLIFVLSSLSFYFTLFPFPVVLDG